MASLPLLALAGPAARAAPQRQWSATGRREPQLDGLDAAIQQAMRAASVRAAAIAIASKGKTLFERGYTWAEPGYPITQPSSPFRLASVSKTFTAALAYEMVRAGKIKLDTPVFAFLALDRFARPGRPRDPGLAAVTVKHLIDHSGGWDRDVAKFDPPFGLRDIARSLGLHRAPTLEEVAGYMLGEPLQFTPGTQEHYSNFGYDLLGLVGAKAANMDFILAVQKYVTGPLGVEALMARTAKERRLPGEGFYDSPGVGDSAEFPDRSVRMPSQYGAGALLEVATPSMGIAASAGAVARTAGSYAAWGYGGRSGGSSRSGAIEGTASWLSSRSDGLDVCYVFNTRDFGNAGAAIDTMHKEINRVVDKSHIGCEVSVYWDGDLRGDLWRTRRDQASIAGGWNDQISSITVTSGEWEFFEHGNYGGRKLALGAGNYPTLTKEWNNVISSFRCIVPTLAR